ncbi:hypothetical protein H7R52_14610 [Weissella confusa]|uniref:Uncharacterized protein n=1 Tax=Weissella confusa TaxID=1583 RepID=A0A923NF67_WEICO|nr:hypothetical protein [Weissella confusa]
MTGAAVIALIAETALFDYTMFFIPTTWLIRFSYMATIGYISIIHTVQCDRLAGNFMITTHLRNAYFAWGEMQVLTHWMLHSVLALISYDILVHMTHISISWLPIPGGKHMTSKIVAVEFIKHRKRLLPAVLLSYLMATLALALYLPRLQQPGQFVVLVKLFMGLFSPVLMMCYLY